VNIKVLYVVMVLSLAALIGVIAAVFLRIRRGMQSHRTVARDAETGQAAERHGNQGKQGLPPR
jgi:hypothetical protein